MIRCTSFRWLSILLWLYVAAVGGCNGNLPATVTGQVTLNGTPIPHGAVVFYPIAGGPAVHGQIQSDGRYELRTGTAKGLQVGEYAVTVMHRRGQPHMGMTPAQIDALDITPTKYRSRESTDLKFTINSGKNEINIPLQSPP